MTDRERILFNRAELLLGKDAMQKLSSSKVILFGLGGVGGWCAESLARTGVGNITLVDADTVCPTNINRQVMATVPAIGTPKVEAMKERLLSINPEAHIDTIQRVYGFDTADSFDLDSYDVVVDAIDSLTPKALLILRACDSSATLFSSMGAALKKDPTRVKTAEFWAVNGCPLAAALRKKFRRRQEFPSRKFRCVYSDELLDGKSDEVFDDGSMSYTKKVVNGTHVNAVATFGFVLGGLVEDFLMNR